MSTSPEILDAQLKAIDPVDLDDLDRGSPEELIAAILATDPGQDRQGTSRRRRHGRPVPRWALVPAVALLVAGLVLAVGLPGGDEEDGSVGAALTDVAQAAAAQSPAPASGPYLYLKTRSQSVDTAIAGGQAWSVYHYEIRQEWASADGAGLARIESRTPSFVGPGDRAAWEAAGSPDFAPLGGPVRVTEERFPAGTFEDVSDLPTDPEELATRLRAEAEAAGNGAPVPARTLDLIGDTLRNPTASPQLRAALYEAALQVPGIELLGEETDPVGRTGVAVGFRSDYSGSPTVFSLIYDPESTEVLATEQTVQRQEFADADGPLVTSATVYLEAGRTSSMPEGARSRH